MQLIPVSGQRPLRLLMLATYFPKPLNPLMGNWALSQALALRRQGVELQVVSFTAWVPKLLARTSGAKAYAHCPDSVSWDGLCVRYPRWLVYPVRPVKSWGERNPELFLKMGWQSARLLLARTIEQFQPDLIFAHHTAVNGYLAERLHRWFGLPYVVTDHDFGEITSCERWPRRRRVFERVVRNSSMMVAVASRMESDIKRLFPGARACTVQNGTDPIPEELLCRPRPKALRGRIVLFSCGAFYERKGMPLLVEAFARVMHKHPRAVLRIAGDGAEREKVEENIRRFGLSDCVVLLGMLPHQAVLQEMAWSDAFVLLGWNEPFATVFSEAASAGKPILCCDDGGFNDVLQHEVQGLTVPPQDVERAAQALDRLLADEDLRLRMGEAAQRMFESRLRWDHNAGRMLQIFREAAQVDARP